jgi:hypothetical protein
MPMRVESTESLLCRLLARVTVFGVAVALAIAMVLWIFGSLPSERSPSRVLTVAQITEEGR